MGVKLSEWRLKVTDNVSSVLGKITGAGDKASARFTALQDKVSGFTSKVQEASRGVPGLGSALELLANPYALATAAVVALTVALGSAEQKAEVFEHGMAQVNTTAQLNQRELGGLTDKLLDMGSNSTTKLDQIPSAFNSVISAVGDTQKSLDIFEPSLKAAQAGFTDIKVVTEAATNVLGAVGNATPTEVFDVLFATMRQGKAEFSDIAGYLPKILPLSNAVGISFKEVAGAYALMTAKGQSSEYTTTLLSNAMTALSKSEVIYGSKSKAGFERSGVAIFDHAGKMRSLVDIVDDLAGRTQGMNDKQRQAFLAGLGLDAQAASAFSIMAQNAEGLRTMVGGTTNSAGEMNAALEASANTTDRLTMLHNKWEAAMTRIGYALMPIVDQGINLINSAMELLTEHSGGFAQLLKVAGYLVAVVLVPLFYQVKAALTTIYVAWRVINAAITFGFTIVKQLFTWMGQAVDWVYRKLGGEGSLIDKMFGGAGQVWQGIKTLFSNFEKITMATLDALDLASAGHFEAARDRFKAAFAEVKTPYDAAKAEAFMDQTGLNLMPKLLGPKQPDGPTLKDRLSGGKKPGLTGPDPKTKAGIKAVNDGGRQVRNVTVNIGSLVKELKVMAATAGEASKLTEEFIIETVLRAVSGAEAALATS